MRKFTMLSVLLATVLLGATSCGGAVSQEEYDRLNNELSAVEGQLASLNARVVEYEKMETEYADLSQQYDAVKSDYEAIVAENEELNEQFDTLKSNYEMLNEQYILLTGGGAEMGEEDIGQAIFDLVNEDRISSGLDELMWGENLYKYGMSNNRKMVTSHQIEYSEYPSFQQIFWATGYTTIENLASAALTVWKNSKQYDRIFLNAATPYGAVAVYKSGEIFYITFISDYFK